VFRQDIDDMKYFALGGDLFKDSGCALASVFHIAEQLNRKYYCPRMVMMYAVDMKTVGAIDKDFVVVWDKAFEQLGLETETKFESADYECLENEYEVLKLEKPGYIHFVPGDGKGHYSWDSLGVRDSQKYYTVAEKRIITFKGFI
jgi:hypothetical protein